MKKSYKGVTLVEIAIVLVIIGLLLGGVLKGQELINNAKVRSIADRQNSLKVAWFAFIDRFQAMPGDFVRAQQYIPGAAAATGDTGDGLISEEESVLALQNMTAAGYLRCPQCTMQAATEPRATNSMQNNYGGVMGIFHDSEYYANQQSGATGNTSKRLQLHTGPRIPSNIISEVDRKIDDGIPGRGDFVFNYWDPTGIEEPQVGQCTSLSDTGQSDGTLNGGLAWRHALAEPPVWNNCGASVFF